jgi:hypothetical protein
LEGTEQTSHQVKKDVKLFMGDGSGWWVLGGQSDGS